MNTGCIKDIKITKTTENHFSVKHPCFCPAVSEDVHHHSANKDPPQPSLFREGDDGPVFTEKENRSINDDDDVNVNPKPLT